MQQARPIKAHQRVPIVLPVDMDARNDRHVHRQLPANRQFLTGFTELDDALSIEQPHQITGQIETELTPLVVHQEAVGVEVIAIGKLQSRKQTSHRLACLQLFDSYIDDLSGVVYRVDKRHHL